MERLNWISTSSLLQPARVNVSQGQRLLREAQQEATTGRRADVGLSLGSRIATAISARNELGSVDAIAPLLEQAQVRAKVTQKSMEALSGITAQFRSLLTGARGAGNGRALAASGATSALEASQAIMATTHDGVYLFGGLNTGVVPLSDYLDGPQQAIINAFQGTFGFLPEDHAASALTTEQVDEFLDAGFANLFSDGNWRAVWSSATPANPLVRLSSLERIDISANTDQLFARSLARAFSMIAFISSANVSQSVFQHVVDRALLASSEAQLLITQEQARVGLAENRLKVTRDVIDIRRSQSIELFQSLESVESYEAASRVNALITQLEASYTLTARISRLSLLSYL